MEPTPFQMEWISFYYKNILKKYSIDVFANFGSDSREAKTPLFLRSPDDSFESFFLVILTIHDKRC
jgi:hypothetical protein